MKRSILSVAFIGFVLIFGTYSASARSSTTKVDAKVPFTFSIGDRSFPAGKYVIRITRSDTGFSTFELQDAERNTLMIGMVSTHGDRGVNSSELVFDRVSGRAVLARIVTPDNGYSLPRSFGAKTVASAKKIEGGTINN